MLKVTYKLFWSLLTVTIPASWCLPANNLTSVGVPQTEVVCALFLVGLKKVDSSFLHEKRLKMHAEIIRYFFFFLGGIFKQI